MDRKRAMEIVASKEMAKVTYNDEQVYIETVNENKNTASIHFIDEPEKSKEVSLSGLIEHI